MKITINFKTFFPSICVRLFCLSLIMVLFQSLAFSQEEAESETTMNTDQKEMIGKVVPDFELPDLNWEDVTLSKVESKVILVDFWASWCKYCRLFNQEISDLQEVYGEKGFLVVSVSLDTDYYKWKRAMKVDEIDWVSVNDNTGMDSETAQKFKITQTPTTFLLNENKEVVAINLEGEELENKIKELLK